MFYLAITWFLHCTIYLQGLTEARRKEFETEEHMLKLAEREDGRLHQEIKRIMKQMDELNEKINIYEAMLLSYIFS